MFSASFTVSTGSGATLLLLIAIIFGLAAVPVGVFAAVVLEGATCGRADAVDLQCEVATAALGLVLHGVSSAGWLIVDACSAVFDTAASRAVDVTDFLGRPGVVLFCTEECCSKTSASS